MLFFPNSVAPPEGMQTILEQGRHRLRRRWNVVGTLEQVALEQLHQARLFAQEPV